MIARLNPDLLDTATPPIPDLLQWAARYDGRRGPKIDLCQAAPGYPPDPGMVERLAAAAATVGYGPVLGDPAVREAYAADVSAVYGADVGADQVAITAGCNQAFVIAMLSLARRGDAVLLPTPWYFNHKMTCDFLGIDARPLPARAERGFVPDPADAERLLDDRVKAIVLVTPNNPTGAIYPAETIDAFAALCRRRGLWLVLDETYRDFRPADAARPHGLLAEPGWDERLVQLYSFSKSYCMPGYRLGAIAAGADYLAQAAKLMDSIQICAPRPGQQVLPWAIPALRPWRAAKAAEIAGRAAVFAEALARLPGWQIRSIGAFFAYVEHPFPESGIAVAQRLAAERGVACLPGGYFGPGQERFLRIAFANAEAAALATLPERLADG